MEFEQLSIFEEEHQQPEGCQFGRPLWEYVFCSRFNAATNCNKVGHCTYEGWKESKK